jgi:hypothetical protein
VRQVRHNGEIKFDGDTVFISEVLSGEPVGLYQTDEHLWRLYFSMVPLAILDTRTMRITRIKRRTSNRQPGVRGAAPPAGR